MLRTVRFSKRSVHSRDMYTCQYCLKEFPRGDDTLSIDHIVPRSKGGTSSWDNVVTACKPCNRIKSNKTLESLGWTLKKKPIVPTWTFLLDKSNVNRDYWKKFL